MEEGALFQPAALAALDEPDRLGTVSRLVPVPRAASAVFEGLALAAAARALQRFDGRIAWIERRKARADDRLAKTVVVRSGIACVMAELTAGVGDMVRFDRPVPAPPLPAVKRPRADPVRGGGARAAIQRSELDFVMLSSDGWACRCSGTGSPPFAPPAGKSNV